MSVDPGGNIKFRSKDYQFLNYSCSKMLRRVLLANNWRHAGTEPVISVETTFTLKKIKNNALKVSNLCLSDPKFKPI